jgi:Mn2+/Fe2+ NRAMP family transporter
MLKSFFKSLGPGLLFAGAAIGVSHLVQSTKAGADFGFGLLWALLLVHIFKYPFFQFGPRYAAATGESLLDGYRKLGKGVLVIYFVLNLASMFTIQAAVTIVTAGLAANVFGLTNDLAIWSLAITLMAFLILALGKYKLLDNMMKYIIILLTITTFIAVAIALGKNTNPISFVQILPTGTAEIGFLIAFLGWMPAPLDVSIWQSLWSIEKQKNSNSIITPKQAIFDFNVGYISTLIIGICFVALGTLVMFYSNEVMQSSAVAFCKQLINMYTKNLGNSAYYIIAIAALTTMFSTTITTLDASPRSMSKSVELLRNKVIKKSYWVWISILAIGTIVILFFLKNEMKLLIEIATVLSFLSAPFYAITNLILVTGKHMPKEHRPSAHLKLISYFGITFLLGFSLWFLTSL